MVAAHEMPTLPPMSRIRLKMPAPFHLLVGQRGVGLRGQRHEHEPERKTGKDVRLHHGHHGDVEIYARPETTSPRRGRRSPPAMRLRALTFIISRWIISIATIDPRPRGLTERPLKSAGIPSGLAAAGQDGVGGVQHRADHADEQ